MRLKSKVAIVTVASQGIGRVIARRIAGEGARTVITARRELNLQKSAEKIVSEGGTCLVAPADLTDETAIVQLV